MKSPILRTGTRYLFPLLILFSFFLLLRGHNEPGGGFIGGLLCATAFSLYAIAFDVESSRRLLRVSEHSLLGVGLLLAGGAGIVGLVMGEPFMTGQWVQISLPLQSKIKIGTPVVFDVGVYLVVVGMALMVIYALAEEDT